MDAEVLQVGATVGDKYQIIELLGKGGMSNVWLARDLRLDKLWAIKEIRPNVDGVRGRRIRQALLDEASFMKRLDHPAIPRIVDIMNGGATAFVIMDYVEGRSLATRMRLQGSPFTQDEVIDWGLQLCDVLSYLHGLTPPVIYRDLKPANIIVREDGSLRLIDFGIAVEEPRACAGSEAVGTPGYAAPEQLPDLGRLSVDLDVRADIYALGVTLYVLASGHSPSAPVQGGRDVSPEFDLRPLRVWDPSLSEGLERIVMRATVPEREGRYGSVDEMGYDLAHYEELTDRWRQERVDKLRGFQRKLLGAGVSLAMGLACLGAQRALRETTYADLMHEAQTASRVAAAGQQAPAERVYTKAIELEPQRMGAYQGLLEVYVADGSLDRREAQRWQELCGSVRDLEKDARYARLCLEVAVSYVAYFCADEANAASPYVALESMDAAVPWLERALAASDSAGDTQKGLSEDELAVARTYLVIARFHAEAQRMEREGILGGDTYRAFWDALTDAVREGSGPAVSVAYPEGVRVRLYQACVEAMASPAYLAGLARAGVSKAEVEGLLATVRRGMETLGSFEASPEFSAAYGRMIGEVRKGLELVNGNIETTYGNPVAVWGDE